MMRLVIAGRPNVGKSTLFNRLIGKRRALVHDEPGVTRDRIEEKTTWLWGGRQLDLLVTDTGGMLGEKFDAEISRQVQMAADHANLILFVVNGQEGLVDVDRDVALRLRRLGKDKTIWLLVNKVDTHGHEDRAADFYELGFDRLFTVSAEHDRGIDDLKDAIFEDFEEYCEPLEGEPEKDRTPQIAIVGRPNAGKSTFTNALLKEERMITSPMAGTTIDAVDSYTELNGHPFILIDTAGIRRKSKTEKGVEVLSVVQARKALERAELAILMIDGEEGPSDQDEKIGSLIEEAGCSMIVAVNKWDTQKSNPGFTKKIAVEWIQTRMTYLNYAPLIFISAKNGTGFKDLGDLMHDILEQRRVKIDTREYTEWVRKESEIHNPHGAKFYMCHQSGSHPPSFVGHVNDPKKIDFSLKRHLVNAMRSRWGFMGSPVRLHFVKSRNRSEQD
ncbi:MAG: ribosome biogenesis GTPase Der [Bacteriovoracia bacterium]